MEKQGWNMLKLTYVESRDRTPSPCYGGYSRFVQLTALPQTSRSGHPEDLPPSTAALPTIAAMVHHVDPILDAVHQLKG
jgi:hypothetical protein